MPKFAVFGVVSIVLWVSNLLCSLQGGRTDPMGKPSFQFSNICSGLRVLSPLGCEKLLGWFKKKLQQQVVLHRYGFAFSHYYTNYSSHYPKNVGKTKKSFIGEHHACKKYLSSSWYTRTWMSPMIIYYLVHFQASYHSIKSNPCNSIFILM